MICAVHQPNFLPYLGFFDKLYHCDVFVLYDTAQFVKREFHNRNRIIGTHGEPQWLTVPVTVRFGQQIADVSIAGDGQPFRDQHLRTLEYAYGHSPGASQMIPAVAEAYGLHGTGSLVELNVDLLDRVVALLGGGPRRVLASELGIDPTLRSTDALVAIVQAVEADTYLSGAGGRGYLDENSFVAAGLNLAWQGFQHPVYPQRGPHDFVPNLSIVDGLCELGPQATAALLTQTGR
jgi:WbqC-like protein family